MPRPFDIRRPKFAALLPAAFLAAGALSSAALGADEKVTYQDHALPIFRNSCLNCHNPDKKKAGLDLSTYAGALAGSDNGPVINSGDAGGSKLFKVITHAEEPEMPPKKEKLADKELEVIRKWIAGGVLETVSGKPAVASRPKVDLSVVTSAVGKPSGPIAMPKGLSTEPFVHTGRTGALLSLAASPWAPLVAVGGQRQVLLYNSQTLDLVGVLPFPEGLPHVLTFSRNGNLLLAGGGVEGKSGKVVLYDVATGKRLTEIGDEFDAVIAADLTPDQSIVALGGPGKVVKGYSVADGQLLFTIKKHTDWITAIAFSPDGNLLATADRAGNLAVWEAKTGRDVTALAGHKEGVSGLAFRDDSKVLASCSTDGTIKLWNLDEGKELKSWAGHGTFRPPTGAVGAGTFDPGVGAFSVAFAHDGRLVSAGRDKLVKTWKSDGAAERSMEPFGDVALRAAFDADGQRVVGGDWTGKIKVWNVTDGKPVGELMSDPPTVAERLEAATKRLAEAQPAIDKATAELAAARDAKVKVDVELAEAQSAAGRATSAEQAAKSAAKQAETLADALKKVRAEADGKERDATRLAAAVKQAEDESKNAGGNDAKALEAAVAEKQKALDEADAALAVAKEAAGKNTEDAAAAKVLDEAKARVERRAKRLADAKAALAAKPQSSMPTEAVAKAKGEADRAADEAKAARERVTSASRVALEADGTFRAATDAAAKAKADAAAADKAIAAKTDAAKSAALKLLAAQKTLDDAQAAAKGAKVGVARLKADRARTALNVAEAELADREAKANALRAEAKAAQAAAEKAAAEAAAFEKNLPSAPDRLLAARKEREQARTAAPLAQAVAADAVAELKSRQDLVQQATDFARNLSNLSGKNKDDKALADAADRAKGALGALTANLAIVKPAVQQKADAAKASADALAASEIKVAALKDEVTNGPELVQKTKAAATDALAQVKAKQTAAEGAAAPIEQAKAKVQQLKGEYDALAREADQLATAGDAKP